MRPRILVELNPCHTGQILHLVLLVLLPCICAEIFNLSVMLLVGYTDIHPACLEICLGESEGNKSTSLFYRTYLIFFSLPFFLLYMRAAIPRFRKVNSYISIQNR